VDVRRITEEYERWLAGHTTLVPAALEKKHALLAKGAFPFLRGTFYLWVRRWPEVCPELTKAPEVLGVGDLHVENFGTWRDAEGRLVWGVNDFDEAHRCAYALDLVRLATSALLAKEEGQLAIGDADASRAIQEGYAEELEAGGRPFVLGEKHRWLRDLATAAREPDAFWQKIRALPPFDGNPPADALRGLEALLPEKGLAYERRARVAGVGSLGLVRIVALAEWQGGPIVREAKARVPSALVWASGGSEADHYEEILSRAVRAPDPLVRVLKGWLVRRLAPDCKRVELESLPRGKDEARLLGAMGKETANVHVGDPNAARAVQADLRGRPKSWLQDAARRMADAVIADAKAWRK
jgi:hypothetical protein